VGCDCDVAYLPLGGRPDPVFDYRVRIREAGGRVLHWEQCQRADRGYQRLVEIAIWPKSEQRCAWAIRGEENRKMLADPIVSECTDPRIDMTGLSLTDSRNQLY
jgi:hypothetical protein